MITARVNNDLSLFTLDNSIATLNTWIWTIVYYTPLIVTLGLIVLSMVQLIRSARKVDQ